MSAIQPNSTGISPLSPPADERTAELSLQAHGPLRLVNHTLRLYRQNWLFYSALTAPILAIAGLLYLAMLAGENYLTTLSESRLPLLSAGRVAGGAIILFPIQALVAIVLTLAIVSKIQGQSARFGWVFHNLARQTKGLTTALLATLLVSIVLMLFGLLPLVGWLFVPGMLVFLTCLAGLVAPIAVIEPPAGLRAVARAWGLARQHFWRILLYWLLIGFSLLLLVELPANVMALLGRSTGLGEVGRDLIGPATRLLVGLIYAPLYGIFVSLIYFDLRSRTEAANVQHPSAARPPVSDEPLEAPAVSPQAGLSRDYAPHGIKNGRLITKGELGKFALTTVGAGSLAVALLIGLAFWLSVRSEISEAIHTAMTIDTVAPDFTLADLDNQAVTLSDFRGKPTIINFWATWCPPCRRELPVLQATYTEHHARVNLVTVTMREEKSTVRSFAREHALTFLILTDPDGHVDELYHIRGVPTTLFIDANGVIVNRHVGALDEATMASYLEPLLQQAQSAAATR